MKNPFVHYIVIYFLMMSLVIAVFAANYLFLVRTKEIASFQTIVPFQSQHDVLYGPVLMTNMWDYKLQMVRYTKPEIVALGSSRTMALTSDAFKVSFINAGGGMLSPKEGSDFVRAMVRFYRPPILIVGVDLFWFTDKHLIIRNPHIADEEVVSREKLTSPFLWLSTGKIHFGDYVRVLCGEPIQSPWVSYEIAGVMAMADANGFRKDGSRFYGNRYSDDSAATHDYNWSRLMTIVKNHGAQFENGDHVDEDRFSQLMDLAAVCHANGISLVLLATPPSLSAYRILQSQPKKDYAYMTDVIARLSKPGQSFEFYDVMDLSKVGSNDCECTDAVHPGNTSYDKIIRYIVTTNPKSVLTNTVDLPALNRLISRFEGRALALTDMSKSHFKEVDFLGLGCQKNREN